MSPCLFCEIAAGRIPCTEVHNDEKFLAFRDIDPKAPTHILIIPKRHIPSLARLTPEDEDLMGELMITAAGIAQGEGLADPGYRFVINCGAHGGQTVSHLHLHILGGRNAHLASGLIRSPSRSGQRPILFQPKSGHVHPLRQETDRVEHPLLVGMDGVFRALVQSAG